MNTPFCHFKVFFQLTIFKICIYAIFLDALNVQFQILYTDKIKSNQIMHKAFIDGQQIPMYNLYDLPQFFRGKLQIKKS